ncbi:hypothetical protein ACQPXH_00230 [Nocardia sp. CA-135953]|uniref:hypothetical protein n=1 Tax=Nocardia sp. CA-135953 TaxID=3239978 RepID=UPI003D963D7F
MVELEAHGIGDLLGMYTSLLRFGDLDRGAALYFGDLMGDVGRIADRVEQISGIGDYGVEFSAEFAEAVDESGQRSNVTGDRTRNGSFLGSGRCLRQCLLLAQCFESRVAGIVAVLQWTAPVFADRDRSIAARKSARIRGFG